jgi:hypothetical protein
MMQTFLFFRWLSFSYFRFICTPCHLQSFVCQHWVLKPRTAPSSILSVASNVVGPVHPSIPSFCVVFIYCVFQLCGGGQFYRWMKPDRVHTNKQTNKHTHTNSNRNIGIKFWKWYTVIHTYITNKKLSKG